MYHVKPLIIKKRKNVVHVLRGASNPLAEICICEKIKPQLMIFFLLSLLHLQQKVFLL
jgi:hypothetical protein